MFLCNVGNTLATVSHPSDSNLQTQSHEYFKHHTVRLRRRSSPSYALKIEVPSLSKSLVMICHNTWYHIQESTVFKLYTLQIMIK
jgi:hypothetical protein